MSKGISTKDMVITALLIALGIMIPTVFGFLRVVLPPAFTATLLAHVPIFIAMFISPWSAIFTAIGTTLGFLVSGVDLVVTARAGSHIVFAIVGAIMIKKRVNLVATGVVVTIIHAFFEALTVFLFLSLGWTANKTGAPIVKIAFFTTGIGTIIHSTIDYCIACVVGFALAKAKLIPHLPAVWGKSKEAA